MKWAVTLLLLLFITFLSTPTIVSLIEKNCDTSYFYSMSEEELTHKEVKAQFKYNSNQDLVVLSRLSSGLIFSENLSKHDRIAMAIFIPPPNQV